MLDDMRYQYGNYVIKTERLPKMSIKALLVSHRSVFFATCRVMIKKALLSVVGTVKKRCLTLLTNPHTDMMDFKATFVVGSIPQRALPHG